MKTFYRIFEFEPVKLTVALCKECKIRLKCDQIPIEITLKEGKSCG